MGTRVCVWLRVYVLCCVCVRVCWWDEEWAALTSDSPMIQLLQCKIQTTLSYLCEAAHRMFYDFIECLFLSCVGVAVLQLWTWFSARQQNHCGVVIKCRCLGHWHQQWSTGTLLDTPWLLGSFVPSISSSSRTVKDPSAATICCGDEGRRCTSETRVCASRGISLMCLYTAVEKVASCKGPVFCFYCLFFNKQLALHYQALDRERRAWCLFTYSSIL